VTRPSRLLVFTENYARGGGNRYCVDLVNALAGPFDEIVLAVNDGGLFPEDRARLADAVRVVPAAFITRARVRHTLRRLPRPLRAPLLAVLSLVDPVLVRLNVRLLGVLLRRHRPDVVLSCNGGYPAARATLAMMLAARRAGVPAALSVVSTPSLRSGLQGRYDRMLDRAVWDAARLVIVNADAIARALTDHRDLPPSLARVVRNGLPDALPPNAPPAGDAVGFVARLDRAKGVLVLLDAFEMLASRHPSIRLRLIGEGDASAAVGARARSAGLAHRIDATGFTAGNVHALLESFRVYAFPSFHEGLPYSILEAMRAGCAIVSTSVGGIPEVLADGREALLVPAGDAAALAAAIERLLDDAALSRRLAGAARARFEQDHLLEHVAVRVEQVFMQAGLLSPASSPRPSALQPDS
jgi:glycosyltransferase involved in cell wall biosynthesis